MVHIARIVVVEDPTKAQAVGVLVLSGEVVVRVHPLFEPLHLLVDLVDFKVKVLAQLLDHI